MLHTKQEEIKTHHCLYFGMSVLPISLLVDEVMFYGLLRNLEQEIECR